MLHCFQPFVTVFDLSQVLSNVFNLLLTSFNCFKSFPSFATVLDCFLCVTIFNYFRSFSCISNHFNLFNYFHRLNLFSIVFEGFQLFCIGATICNHREIHRLQYAGFKKNCLSCWLPFFKKKILQSCNLVKKKIFFVC